MSKKASELQLRSKLNGRSNFLSSSNPSIVSQLNNNTKGAYDSIQDYNKDTNEHRKAVFSLVKKEIDEKIYLRTRAYKCVQLIFLAQLIGSSIFLYMSLNYNFTHPDGNYIVSDNLLIAVVVTLTGSFLSFMGIAHKYIFSSSKEFFDYARGITLHQKD